MRKHTLILFLSVAFSYPCIGQDASTDSIVKAALESQSLTGEKDKGLQLIKEDNWSEANKYFTGEIKKNDADREAYFGRGVVNWAQNNVAGACRDWSAVLAMGDTATFKLLDQNCGGNMVLDHDTIPSQQYRKMFAKQSPDKPQEVHQFVEEMPEFPGGQQGLFDYLRKNFRYPTVDRKQMQGKVYVGFVISSRGKVLFPHVERGLGSGLDEEAVRVIRSMPDWKPGKKKGKAVPVRYSLPVSINWK